MYGVIDGYDFGEMECQRYFSPPSTWSDDRKKDNARMKIFSGDYLGSEKKDGFFTKLIKDEDGTIIVYSRSRGVNGQYADKHEWLPQLNSFFKELPRGVCLLGELYLPSKPGSRNVTAIMGCLKEKAIERQKKGEYLRFYAFDILAWDGKNWIGRNADERFSALEQVIPQTCQYVEIAHYVAGEELWNTLQKVLGRGDEGVVITYRGAKYEPGKRPGKTTLKIKKELKQTIDCFFTGNSAPPTRQYNGKEIETWQYWENLVSGEKKQGTLFKDYQKGAAIEPVTKGYFYGWRGSLEIAVLRHREGSKCRIRNEIFEDTEVFPIGWLSGLPDEMKADPEKYAFRPIEVNAMEFCNVACTLRHGKMVGWRDDLTLQDCTFEKIIG